MSAQQPGLRLASGYTLVTGPANGGKSLWAETLAARSGLPVIYMATGPSLPDDADWQQRLQRHRLRRPAHWQCQEVGLQLCEALRAAPPGYTVLVDALGTWVAAGLDRDPADWHSHCVALEAALSQPRGPVILVGEEVAWGVVPTTASGCLFRQRLGALLQTLMPRCAAAWLVLHGRAIDLLACSVPINPEPSSS